MIRRAVLLLTFTLALPCFAQTQRLVSRIEVRGSVPAAIVISQSALVEGRGYSDADLDAAVARLRRLPFVHDARYALEGETLVLEIDGATPLFFDVQALGARSDFDTETSTMAGGGGRVFHGSGGVAEGRVMKLLADADAEATRGEVGYSYYGIGGTRLFATAKVEAMITDVDGFSPDPAWQLTVGYPLTVRQTISAIAQGSSFSNRRTVPGLPRELESRFDDRLLTLRWAYDTTDDPLFTRSGSLVSAGPSWGWQDTKSEGRTFPIPAEGPTIETRRSNGTFAGLGADARKYLPVGARGALSAGLETSLQQEERDFRTDDGPVQATERDFDVVRLSLGYGYNFFDRSSPAGNARHRAELGVTASRRRSDFALGTFTEKETTVNAGYIFRKPYGTVQLNLAYGFQ